MLNTQIIKTYSDLHSPVNYTNGAEVSFEGSQKQKEFFQAWECIENFYKDKKPTTLNFLEVGAWKGLWGLAFTEFCKLNNIEGKYVTITMIDHDPNNRPLHTTLAYINKQSNMTGSLVDMNTMHPDALQSVQKLGSKYNIVFIDAGHKLEEVLSDINKFKPLAKDLLVFHDIRPKQTTPNCGVYEALQLTNTRLDIEIAADEVGMGIGIKYI